MRMPISHANIVLCELEQHLASQLQVMLCSLGDRVSQGWKAIRKADLVFCGNSRESLRRVLGELEAARHRVPVVVVSDEADVASWLDALEAGASDYLAAPFERAQLDWIRQTQLAAPAALQ